MSAGEEGGGGTGVIAGAVALGFAAVEAETAEDEQIVLDGLEGSERGAQLERAEGGGGEVGHPHAVGEEEEGGAGGGLGGGAGGREEGRHGLEPGERHGDAEAAEHGSTGEVGSAHCVFPFRFRKASLVTMPC